ncbi:MAG: hypothetical protein KKA31_02200 [Candidatus Margulisbacteria bacterium]|nr:hypothetical protein [Candidatus Margulisiibacteriota bacterium]
MTLTGREKATIFLSILGAEASARVLRYLPDELADLIAAGINHLPSPSPQALSEVINEFQGFLALPAARPEPPRIEEKSAPPTKPKKSYSFLMYERPQMVAYLLSLMPDEEKDEALQSLPKEKSIIEELLAGLKTNPLSPKLAIGLKKQFAGKLF